MSLQQLEKARIDMVNESEKREKHEITIYVNNQPFKTNHHELTGAQIKALSAVPAEYELFHVEEQKSVSIGNDERVRLHENEQFRAIPSGTFGRKWLCLRG
ncbi:MAG: multiubiquitin domain-containing protein [Terriglobales bacterium]